MLENWQAFLQKQGASIENNRVVSFKNSGNKVNTDGQMTVLCDLSHYRLYKVSGTDAVAFLQGQLSNDINQVSEQHSQLSSYCSPKGRALALLRIFQIDNNYFISLPDEIADKTVNRLKMFVLRSDVVIDDVTEQFFHFGLAGSAAGESISAVFDFTSLPDETDQAIVSNGVSCQKLPGSLNRYELFGPVEQAIESWTQLSESCVAEQESSWNLQRIQAGIPEILIETSEEFVPQMLNLQLINAVNFQKGCYPGQEIVARTKYLGKLKKRLYLIETNEESDISAGTDLYESGDNQQSVGKVVSIEPAGTNIQNGLAVLRISAVDNQPITLASKDGSAIKLLDMPYAFEE